MVNRLYATDEAKYVVVIPYIGTYSNAIRYYDVPFSLFFHHPQLLQSTENSKRTMIDAHWGSIFEGGNTPL